MPEGAADAGAKDAGAGNADPNAGKGAGGQPTGQAGAGGQQAVEQRIQAAVDAAVAEVTGRWAKKVEKANEEKAALEAKLTQQGTGGDATERSTVKQLEAQLGIAKSETEKLTKRIGSLTGFMKQAKLIEALAEAGLEAFYPAQVAEMMGPQVGLTDSDALFVPDAEGDPRISSSTGKPMSVVELAGEFAKKYPRLFKDKTASGGGFEGNRGSAPPGDLKARIAEAEAKGDFRTAQTLKAELLRQVPVPGVAGGTPKP